MALMLAGLAIAGQVIAYLLSAMLARLLGVDGFEGYVVAHFGMEVLSALGREATALALFRVAVPVMTFTFVAILLGSPLTIIGPIAVGCWGIALTVALALMLFKVRRAAPPELFSVRRVEEIATWRTEAQPFFVYRISLGLLSQAGVIALDWLQPSAAAVGAYNDRFPAI